MQIDKAALTPEEQVVVDYLSKVEDPQQVIDCVENDVDLAKVVRETLEGPELQFFRMMAHQWFSTHPKYKDQMRDLDKMTIRILDSLERVNPMIAKALLEGPQTYSLSELGLETASQGSDDSNHPASESLDYPRAGMEYLKRTITRFRRLLYV